MKKTVLFLIVAFTIGEHCGFAQNYSYEYIPPKFTKEEAIAAIKANYLFMYFRCPTDTILTINRFIDNINKALLVDLSGTIFSASSFIDNKNKAVPVNKEKREKIKELILSKIKQTEQSKTVLDELNSRWYHSAISVMGINVKDIVENNFIFSDYSIISHILFRDVIHAENAYMYLRHLYFDKKLREGSIIFFNRSDPKLFFDLIFNEYGISTDCGFGQNYEPPQIPKEDAIAAIKENSLYMYFGYPEDTVANINLFINNINKAVPMDKEKGDTIKVLILSKLKQPKEKKLHNDVLYDVHYFTEFERTLAKNANDIVNDLLEIWHRLPNFIPVMGINANDIIKESFTHEDYEKIYERLLKDNKYARYIYRALRYLYTEKKSVEDDVVFLVWGNEKFLLDTVFKEYGITNK